jgi:hypothetical protein
VTGAVAHLAGVGCVESFLHVVGTPAPNKVAALDASNIAAREATGKGKGPSRKG